MSSIASGRCRTPVFSARAALRCKRHAESVILAFVRTCLALLALLVPSVASASGMRCKNQIVSAGASFAEVKAKCGEPIHTDATTEVRTVRQYHPRYGYLEQRVTKEIERWTFVLGDNRLIRTAVFEDGRLSTVRAEGRPARRASHIESCKRAIHSTGDTMGEVMLRCGLPDQEYRWVEEIAEGTRYVEHRVQVPYERWVYNLGPRRFLRILTFRRGRLVDQKTGGRGWELEQPDFNNL